MKWFCKHEWSEILRTDTQLIFLCPICAQTKEVNIYCKHDWEEKERTIIEPTTENLCELYSYNAHAWLITQGITTILYRCKKCGEQEMIEMSGVPKND